MKTELIYRLTILLGLIAVIFIIPKLIRVIMEVYRKIKINELKSHGLKIPVDLKNCSFSESIKRIKKGTIYSEIVDRLFLNKPQDYYDKVSIETQLYYECVIKNKKCRFISKKINTDFMTLSMLFEKYNETIIYVDKDNINNYYFDLTFIN